VYFVLSAGHSGEGFLAELLKVSSEMSVDREAAPSLCDFAGIMHLGRKATFESRSALKIPTLEARLDSSSRHHYADVNHMFAKSQVDIVMDYFSSRQAEYEVHLISLRRWLPQTLQYWLLEDVWDPSGMGQYVGGEYTLYHQGFAQLPPLQPAYAAENSVSLILGYLVDMEIQFADIRKAYPWAVFHQLRFEDLVAKNGTARTLAALDLAIADPLELMRFEGSTIDDPLSWKDNHLRDTPITYFQAQVELFLRAYRDKAVPLPPLPHMARLAPCSTLGVSRADVLAAEAGHAEGVEGDALDAATTAAAGPYVVGGEAWGRAGGQGSASGVTLPGITAPQTPRFLPLGAVGGKTSRVGSVRGGEAFDNYLCGVPPTFMGEEAARAVRDTITLSRNRVGPGASSNEQRALPDFLAKEKERWGNVVKAFDRQRQEYEKYKLKK
jgi:hypothetical protein